MKQFPTSQNSAWLTPPEALCPAVSGDIRADVAIVGGGYTGLYTALQLREEGIDVVVLEQDFAGAGASGRNSGYVDGLIGKDYPSLIKLYKKERARELCGFSQAAVRKLEDFIRSHEIDCEYVGNGNIMSAVHERQLGKLERVALAGKDLGMDFRFLNESAMRERGMPASFVAGIHDPLGGVLNPGLLMRRLREMAIEKGVRLFEQTKVEKVANSRPVTIVCADGTVTADQAVLATNAFTNQLGWKKRLLSPVWAGMFETEPLKPDELEAIGWAGSEGIYTAHEKLESYRRTARNTLIAGGKYVKIPFGYKLKNISAPEMAASIEKVFRDRFPELSSLKMATFWGGWIGIPLDFMPEIGTVGSHQNIHFGIGYAGHGVPQTILVAEILAAQIQGKPHQMAGVLKRRVIPIPPEPFKWLASKLINFSLGIPDARIDRQVRREAGKR